MAGPDRSADPVLRSLFTFALLLLIHGAGRVLYTHRVRWVGSVPRDPWEGIRVLAMLHHTSLYEPIYAAVAPPRFLWRIARHGVAPIARKTSDRPLVGRFFRLMARQVVPISRERDETWSDVLARIRDPDALVVILPEGRMMRPSGLDAHGEPMTVRGGIADILRRVPGGRMLLAYSGGLHHVQAPGETLPRLFQTVRIGLEVVEIPPYRARLLEEAGEAGFKAAVIADLTRRRDRHSPAIPPG